MRLSVLPLLIAGAGVVSLVAAEPIRIDASTNENANIRLGYALANANVNGNDDNVARIVRPMVPIHPGPQYKAKGLSHHFCGASLREKAIRLSNAFRHALGLPLIEAHLAAPVPGHVHILPVGYPNSQEELGEQDKHGKHHGHTNDGGDHEHPGDHEHHGDHDHHGHRGHHGHHEHRRKTFFNRIHRAIKALGLWEGRAVAFVLGCGIGVLLRMFWVLSVLAYRTVRGERGEETLDREYIVYEHVPEIYAAPPQYDEKVKVEATEEELERK